MVELSMPWGGTVIGDKGPYSDAVWSYAWRCMFTKDRIIEGVFQDYGSELEVTNPAGTTIRVTPGIAMVDGKFYYNTGNVDFAVIAPGGGSNYYTIVLQKNWIGASAQTVRAAILGPNAAVPPAVTQVDGTIWEISIATVRITSAGAITITDTRAFRKDSSAFPVAHRQGLTINNTFWASDGINNSIPSGNIIMQIGVISITVGVGDQSGFGSITFPVPFSTEPFVTGHARSNVGVPGVARYNLFCPDFEQVGSGTGLDIWVTRETGSVGAYEIIVYWIAIGPKA